MFGDPPTRRKAWQRIATAAEGGAGGGVPDVAGTLGGASQTGGFRTTDLDNSGAFIPVPDVANTTMDEGQTMVPVVAFDTTQITNPNNRSSARGDTCHTLSADQHAPAIVGFADLADPVAANQARTYTREGTNNFRVSNVAITPMSVRRLTPRECERLQGAPDDFTLIPYNGKLAKDAPRYKVLGNSFAVPVITWIGRRIEACV